jgi:hypothetical protein
MSTNTKVNAELELRPLEDHELEAVNGGSFLSDIGVGLLGGLFVDSALIGYCIANNKLPPAFQERW